MDLRTDPMYSFSVVKPIYRTTSPIPNPSFLLSTEEQRKVSGVWADESYTDEDLLSVMMAANNLCEKYLGYPVVDHRVTTYYPVLFQRMALGYSTHESGQTLHSNVSVEYADDKENNIVVGANNYMLEVAKEPYVHFISTYVLPTSYSESDIPVRITYDYSPFPVDSTDNHLIKQAISLLFKAVFDLRTGGGKDDAELPVAVINQANRLLESYVKPVI